MRAFERALRRAGLPLRMSEGFNPRPRVSFPAALGVGIEGLNEVMEFDLSDWAPPQEVERKLAEQLPPGLDLVSLEVGDPRETAQAAEVTYRITPGPALRGDARFSPSALSQLMAREVIPVQRWRKGKQKSVNIRPFMLSLEREADELVVLLKAGPEGSVHPEEILGVMGFDMPSSRADFDIVRTRVQLSN